MKEYDPSNSSPALQADFKINRIWEADRRAFLDNRINADSLLCNQRLADYSKRRCTSKHKKYDHAAEDVIEFHSLISSAECTVLGIDGILRIHKEYSMLLKRLGETL